MLPRVMRNTSSEVSEEVVSILDTDLLKLTMHCAIVRYFPDVEAVYALDNRTPNKKFSREAFVSLQNQSHKVTLWCS
jgi:nicotinate phosphoribosyltransferase